MFFWLVLSFGAFCAVGASLSLLVLWIVMLLDKRPWLKFALRNPRVIWYWASTWRTRRRIARDAKANATGKVRQEEIGKVVLFGVDATGGGSAKVERVEYWAGGGSTSSPIAVYNLDPDAGETHKVSFPPRATHASVVYRYNDIGYVGLLDKAQDGMDASVGIQQHVGFMGRNFIYDITSGNPSLNEAVERVFGPFGCYRGLPTHLFDYLSRFDIGGGEGEATTVIVRGLQRSFLLDMRTREIQPFQGNMDNTRVVQPPFVFHGLAESVEAADLLFGGHVDVDYDGDHED
jgi:hypothetical protein